MTRSVLILDSSPLMFDQLRSCLKSFACDLSHARSGEEALRLVAQDYFDVVFTELELPGLSGFDVKARMNTQPIQCDIPVIAVSAPADEWTLKRLRSSCFFAFFAKPLDHDRIADIVAPLLAPAPTYATATGVSR